ncbi:MAG: class I SAM-dependent methyltransferase [Terriglobales bacterium]
MPSEARWRRAQAYERFYWEREAARLREFAIDSPDGWYRWKASQMEKHLAGLLPEDRKATARVLEIGCGPVGIVSFLGWGERHAIDPLEDFYRTQEAFSKYRDPAVRFQTARGEWLPFDPAGFDLVILENVLDHVQAAGHLLGEIGRVLKPDGLLYFTVNVRTAWGAALHSLLALLLIDKGHPYSFTAGGIRRFLAANGLRIRRESLDEYLQARAQDRRSPSLRDKIKSYTGLSEFVFYSVCSKAP